MIGRVQMKRILVWGLSNNRAGTERVIESYIEATDTNKACFDFLCYEFPANYSHLFTSESFNRVFVIPMKIKHPVRNWFALKRFMKKHAHEYEAVWFNANDISNIDLLIYANHYGVKRRILHSHNADMPERWITRLFTRLNTSKLDKVVTDRWACSEQAGKFMFGEKTFKIVPNTVPAEKFVFDISRRRRIRKKLGIENCFVVGTVGRLVEQKNQKYLIEILPDLRRSNSDIMMLVIGNGDLRQELNNYAKRLGVSDVFRIVDSQDDIASYLSAFDCFAFPSLYEGLPIALLEAQYNNVPCVISENIPTSAIISTNVRRISLDDKRGWCEAVIGSQRQQNSLIPSLSKDYDSRILPKIAEELFELN